MSKQEFLAKLKKKLSAYPSKDVEERLGFYSEMIDDRMEEGLSETDAVQAVGSIDTILGQIVAEMPNQTSNKKYRKLRTWEIVLLAIGSPIWLSLILSATAIVLSVYVSIWAVVLSLWAIELAFGATAIGGTLGSIIYFCTGNALAGWVMLGVGIMCVGFTIFWFFACRALTKGMAKLTKKLSLWFVNCFRKKEEA